MAKLYPSGLPTNDFDADMIVALGWFIDASDVADNQPFWLIFNGQANQFSELERGWRFVAENDAITAAALVADHPALLGQIFVKYRWCSSDAVVYCHSVIKAVFRLFLRRQIQIIRGRFQLIADILKTVADNHMLDDLLPLFRAPLACIGMFGPFQSQQGKYLQQFTATAN